METGSCLHCVSKLGSGDSLSERCCNRPDIEYTAPVDISKTIFRGTIFLILTPSCRFSVQNSDSPPAGLPASGACLQTAWRQSLWLQPRVQVCRKWIFPNSLQMCSDGSENDFQTPEHNSKQLFRCMLGVKSIS